MPAPDGKAEAEFRSPSNTRTRLGAALFSYMLGVTLVVTLLPFQFEWPVRWHVLLSGGKFDFVANVILFVPLGFLYRLAHTGKRGGPVLSVLCVGALISMTIEGIQLFEAKREATVLDVVANTAGAGLGAAAFDRIARAARRGGRLLDWLALELPLMGLVYLLVPLLWVNSLVAQGQALHTIATFLVGAFGALLLGGIQRYYFGPSGAAEPRHTAAFAVIWFLAGAFALAPSRPLALAAGALALGAVCWWQGGRRLHGPAPNRRFEVPLLRSTAPLYAAYLVLIVVAPPLQNAGAWHLDPGFPEIASNQIEILRLLELGAASTLVGYMVAEIRGREAVRYRDALPHVTAWAVGLAVVVEAVRGYHAGYGASASRGALLAIATVYGGWLYYLQRAHVVWLLSGNPRQRAPSRDDAIIAP